MATHPVHTLFKQSARFLALFLLFVGVGQAFAEGREACNVQILGSVPTSLRQIHNAVGVFSEMAKGPTVTPDELKNAANMAFGINVMLGVVAGDPAKNYNCTPCDPAAIAPKALDNKGYPWSAVGLAKRFADNANRMSTAHPYELQLEAIAEIAAKALARLKSRKQLPFCAADAGGDDQDDSADASGKPVCYKGRYTHTGGPRSGKVHKASICIDWASPCKFVGKGIAGQTVQKCTPKKSIQAEVDMSSGVTLTYDLRVTKGKLRGTWEQSDGASGDWR